MTVSVPRRYPDSKSQPHLRVAKAMLKEGRAVNVGDHIPYVICLDENGHSSNKGVAEALLAHLGPWCEVRGRPRSSPTLQARCVRPQAATTLRPPFRPARGPGRKS